MKKTWIHTSILYFLAIALCGAQTDESSGDSNLKIIPSPVLYGLTIDAGYTGVRLLDEHDTTLWISAGGAYETIGYYRLPDGTMYRGGVEGVDARTDPEYGRLSFNWGAGITQGLIDSGRPGEDLVSAFFRYRGRYDRHFQNSKEGVDQLVFRSSAADSEGLLKNSFLAGLQFDALTYDGVHKISRGVYTEVSAEWAPEWFMNSEFGESDFIRLNGSFKAFLPLYVAPSAREGNLFSVYAGTFLSADYAAGDAVPLYVRQSFGGLNPRTGLGGAVRGVDSGAFDTLFKAVANVELRATLPSLVLPGLVPGVLAYFDTGYYHDIEGPTPVASGLINSAGAGVFINILDLANIAVYAHYFISGVNASGEKFTPVSLSFGLRF